MLITFALFVVKDPQLWFTWPLFIVYLTHRLGIFVMDCKRDGLLICNICNLTIASAYCKMILCLRGYCTPNLK